MAKNKKGMSTGKKVAVGAGLVAATAGAYYFLGPKGKTHQRKAKALAHKVGQEIKKDTKKVGVAARPIAKKVTKKVKSEVKKAIKKVSRR